MRRHVLHIGLFLLAFVAPGATRAMPPQATPAAGTKAQAAKGQGVLVVLVGEDGKESKVALFSEATWSTPVALAAGSPVTLREFADAMANAHQEHAPGSKGGSVDFRPILDRLIAAKLIVVEARGMGMAELPEVRTKLAAFDEIIPREILKQRAVSAVKVDPKAVDKLYKAATRENVVATVLFADERSAKAFAASLGKGVEFAARAKEAVARKEAVAFSPSLVANQAGISPEILVRLSTMNPGAVSPVLRVPQGFAVVQLVRIQYRNDPKARAEAEATVTGPRKREALDKYYLSLKKKYATVDEKLLAQVDLDAAEPGFEKLLEDKRVLVVVKGASPVTVGDLAGEIDRTLFHGAKRAAEGKKLNSRKTMALDNLLFRRLLDHEARVRKVRDTEEFRRMRTQTEDEILFQAFLEKAIIPDLKTTDAEVEQYYKEHRTEFVKPMMVRIEALGFDGDATAQSAIKLLRTGTDLSWLKSNASGRLPDDQVSFRPDTRPIIATDLPSSLAKSLQGVKAGDYRVYAASPREVYAVRVIDVVPESVKPLEEVKSEISGRLGVEKLQDAVDDYGARLRKAHPVKVYVVRIQN